MRIAVIGSRGPSGANLGVERALREICPRLTQRGHDVDIFSERNGRRLAEIEGARLIRLPGFGIGGASVHAALSSLVTAFRGYDVVNFCASEAAGLYSMAARMGLYRTVVSVHGMEGSRLVGPAAAARFADAVVVASRRLERFFRKSYGRETIYIPNGISAAGRPDATALEPFGLEAGSFLLTADRLVPDSGLHLAVAAAAATSRTRLVVIETGQGDPDYAAALKRDADPKSVLFLPEVGEALLEALASHAYLVLMPSLAPEPPPILGVALAHGAAMVVSDQPEHLDVVGPDAFTFTADDPRDLQRVLWWLVHDPVTVARMRRRVAAMVRGHYGWDRIALRYEQVFASVL